MAVGQRNNENLLSHLNSVVFNHMSKTRCPCSTPVRFYPAEEGSGSENAESILRSVQTQSGWLQQFWRCGCSAYSCMQVKVNAVSSEFSFPDPNKAFCLLCRTLKYFTADITFRITSSIIFHLNQPCTEH